MSYVAGFLITVAALMGIVVLMRAAEWICEKTGWDEMAFTFVVIALCVGTLWIGSCLRQ